MKQTERITINFLTCTSPELRAAERKQARLENEYCPECSYIGADKNDVMEHVFANHPVEVGK